MPYLGIAASLRRHDPSIRVDTVILTVSDEVISLGSLADGIKYARLHHLNKSGDDFAHIRTSRTEIRSYSCAFRHSAHGNLASEAIPAPYSWDHTLRLSGV